MNTPSTDDGIEAIFEAPAAYIHDDGFTQRVLGKLPPRRERPWLRPVLLIGSAALGGAAAIGALSRAAAVGEAVAFGPAHPLLVVQLVPLAGLLLAALAVAAFSAVEAE
jgi:hypothetical protein